MKTAKEIEERKLKSLPRQTRETKTDTESGIEGQKTNTSTISSHSLAKYIKFQKYLKKKPPTAEMLIEVESALKYIKHVKAAGNEIVTVELLQYASKRKILQNYKN